MEETTHKKCPFCGGNPYMTYGMGEYWVSCGQCGGGTAMSSVEDVAWQNWDKRAEKE